MIKRSLVFMILIFSCIGGYAQLHKRFIDKKGNTTKDSTKAIAYIVYQLENPDSLWSAVKLSINKIPIFKGTYLDEELTIPHGKFVYYDQVIHQSKIGDNKSTIDTTFSPWRIGVYLNGKKEGIWMDYYVDGKKACLRTYENNDLNGLYEEYDSYGKLYSRCNYIANQKEGDSFMFRVDSSVSEYRSFRSGISMYSEEYSDKDQMYNAYPGYNFEYSVLKYLKNSGLPPAHGNVLISFTVSENGKLLNPKVNMGVNPDLDKALIEALNNCPSWVPAKKNKKKIPQTLTLAFAYDTKK